MDPKVLVEEIFGDELDFAHIQLGSLALINATVPLSIFVVKKLSDGFVTGSTYQLMFKVFAIIHFAFWIVPALLFPFTFDGNETINRTFTVAIEEYAISLPITFYWALASGFFITAAVHKDSKKEPVGEVKAVAALYLLFASTSAFM